MGSVAVTKGKIKKKTTVLWKGDRYITESDEYPGCKMSIKPVNGGVTRLVDPKELTVVTT